MEIDGKDVWEVVRPIVVRIGAKRVIERITADGNTEIDTPVHALIDKLGVEAALRTVGAEMPSEGDTNDAVDEFLSKTQDLKRVSDPVALMILDAWADDEEITGRVAAHIVRAFGQFVDSVEFDSGVPGSGQSVAAWRLKRRYFLTGELGVFEVFWSQREMHKELRSFRRKCE